MPSSPRTESGSSQTVPGSDTDLYGLRALQEEQAGLAPNIDIALEMQPQTSSGAYSSVVATQDTVPNHSSVSGTIWIPLDGDDAPTAHSSIHPDPSSAALLPLLADPAASTSRLPNSTPDVSSIAHAALPSAAEGRLHGIQASRQTESPESGEAGSRADETNRRRRQKYTRSRTGCLACRVRRIKCDEGRPICRRCQTSKRECEFPDPTDLPKRAPRGMNFTSRQRSSSPARSGTKESMKQHTVRSPPSLSKHDPTLALPGVSSGLSHGAVLNSRPFWDGRTELPSAPYAGGHAPPADRNSFSMLHSADTAQLMASNSTPLLSAPNFLLPWFPTPEERSLILHYCANAADLMMAIPSGFNPMLAINLPLALDSPRGHNPSADALRVALLGTGAVHQAFLLARSQVNALQTASMFQHASNLRDTGKAMLRRACSTPGGGAGSDAALGASTALATIDIFFGGSGWQDNFNLARDLVAFRGGPAEMLKAAQPTLLADGVTVSPARVLLEVLAIYETFGCLTSGEAPTLLSDRWDSWWFEGSRSTYEEHSVEKQFGMSKIMVHLFARIAKLLSTTSKLKTPITEEPHPLGTGAGTSQEGSKGLGPGVTEESPTGTGTLDVSGRALQDEARTLSRDIDCWITSLQLVNLEHERVQVGNRAYAHAMKILILRMVFHYPRSDPKVQNAALEVMQHCSISTAALGMSIDLTWPAIIGGCCLDGANRQWVLTLLEGFKSQCCFDVETASRIIAEVWRRVDAGDVQADWKPVCESLGMEVLLC